MLSIWCRVPFQLGTMRNVLSCFFFNFLLETLSALALVTAEAAQHLPLPHKTNSKREMALNSQKFFPHHIRTLQLSTLSLSNLSALRYVSCDCVLRIYCLCFCKDLIDFHCDKWYGGTINATRANST